MAEQFFHCKSCGAAIDENNHGEFCTYCGTKLPKDEVTQETTTNNITNNYNITYVQKVAPTQTRNSAKSKKLREDLERQEKELEILQKKKRIKIIVLSVILGVAVLVWILFKDLRLPIVLIVAGGLFLYRLVLEIKTKTKKCIKCKKDIDKKATVCPYCRSKQGMGCLDLILLTVIIIIVFSTVSGNGS